MITVSFAGTVSGISLSQESVYHSFVHAGKSTTPLVPVPYSHVHTTFVCVQLQSVKVILYSFAVHVAKYSLFPVLHLAIVTVTCAVFQLLHVHHANVYHSLFGFLSVISSLSTL